MTVSYSSEVFTCKATGIFLRLLFRWRGSIYKLVWCDLLVYMTLYSALSLTYRFFLDDEGKEKIASNFKRHLIIMEKLDDSVKQPKYWIPIIWAGSIVTRARKENRIKDDFSLKAVIEELDKYRSKASTLLDYDWITVPLVYTQVVTLAVYSFLLSTLMGRQFLDPTKKYTGHEVDLVVPVFTFLQFFFYMGWLKVAEALINPFGEDDDDFDMNWLIDRNLQVSYLIVDEMHNEHPPMVRDQFWDDYFPELPYTAAAEETRIEPDIGAATQIEITEQEAEFLPLIEEGLASVTGSRMASRRPSRNGNLPSSNLSLKDVEDGIKPDEESSNLMVNFIQSLTSSLVGPSVGSPLTKFVNHRRHRSFNRRIRRGQKSSARTNRSFLTTPDCGTIDREGVSPGLDDLASTLSFDSRIYPPSEEDCVSRADDAQSLASRESRTTFRTGDKKTLPPEQLQARMVSVLESIKEYLEMEKANRSQEGSVAGSNSLDTLYEEDGSRTNHNNDSPMASLEDVKMENEGTVDVNQN
ncbi:bestrophin-2-like [Tigriopus californicus]|uniref:bestrophin-2-like n=1 Tax=Tigriopus californicus TaxID=6832 RepID=UPI0027D9EB2D|nr:bestrophin-2-like [Tigriopus californicus]